MGPSPCDIYIVVYVSENINVQRKSFIEYRLRNGLPGTENSAVAIWNVGKRYGIYLKILNSDGTVQDWRFVKKWISGR